LVIIFCLSCCLAFLLFFRLSKPDHSQYLKQISWYCSTALPHSNVHIQWHQLFFYNVMHFLLMSTQLLQVPFWFSFLEPYISFNVVQIFATSKLRSQTISVHPSYCFWTDVSDSYYQLTFC
jgi:hypothetical protein